MPQVHVFVPDGSEIKARRLRLGLSATQLAGKLGNRHPQTIRRIEAGRLAKVSDVLIHQIANALGAEVAEITKGKAA